MRNSDGLLPQVAAAATRRHPPLTAAARLFLPALMRFSCALYPCGPPLRRAAVQLSACRGKLMDLRPATRALGPLSDWTVPQAWFSHFYALGATWNAAVAWMLFGSGLTLPEGQRASAALALALLQLHLCRRWAETVGLLSYPPGARMHGIAYLFGMRWGQGNGRDSLFTCAVAWQPRPALP